MISPDPQPDGKMQSEVHVVRWDINEWIETGPKKMSGVFQPFKTAKHAHDWIDRYGIPGTHYRVNLTKSTDVIR